MTKRKLIIFLFMSIVYLPGCAENENTGKIKIITTLFPQYDFAKQIAKEKADVRLLLPPGVESHTFEPAPRDIADIKKADLFIYTGDLMEPWVEKIKKLINTKADIVNSSAGITLLDEFEESGDTHESSHEHGGKDPHVWLDPVNAQKMLDNILSGIVKIDPANESFYNTNAAVYKKEIEKLDFNFLEFFKKTKNKTIIYGGHFAFGYFAKRYGLKYISPYKGFSPDAEPTPQKITDLIKTIKKTRSRTIYYEELIEPKVAKVIASESGAKMLLLHGAHNVSKNELKSGISYVSIMRGNLERLREGMY